MQITETIEATRDAVAAARRRGVTVGLVPTMGALHAGHASLLRAARAEVGFVVASIFVNPTQFGPNEDLNRYPRPFERDAELCRAEGVDLLFHPAPATIYPQGYCTFVEVHGLQDVLCGARRPGHFRGVATVVLKLFHIVQPDSAYFGQKDAQQVRILQRMVRDLDVPIEIKVCPIVREPDGLALSSRNAYLAAEQRRSATILYDVLQEVRRRIAAGERRAQPLLADAAAAINAVPGARLDYAAAVDDATLQDVDELRGRILFALAASFGTTRLIDNVIIDVPPASGVPAG